MPALAILDVIFVGLVGADPSHVSSQLAGVDVRVHARKIPAVDAATLAHHGETAGEVVHSLAADGVIVAEAVSASGHYTLRVLVYGPDGGVRSVSEMPMAGKSLSGEELDVLKSNLGDQVGTLIAAAAKKPKPAPAAPPEHAPAPKVSEPAPARAPAKAVTRPAPPAPPPAPPPPPPEPEIDPAPAAPVAVAASDDSVSADEIAAFASSAKAEPTTRASGPELHLAASAGLAVVARSFAPGGTVIGYSSAPVGAARVDARVEPLGHLALDLALEHTLGMTTSLSDGDAPTQMSRWEVSARYAIGGDLQLAPVLGYGHRAFEITSRDAARSPDGTYQYLVIGAAATKRLGSRMRVEGQVAFEPVTSGLEPTEMSLGEARRWAVDLGVAVEARAGEHVFVRAALDYQRFQWSWAMAGGSDSYPSGAIALGVHY